jgi:RNA polymerase sigma-70 factor (ECF subfamily)
MEMRAPKMERSHDVLEALAAGDRARAFTLLMEQFGDDVYRYCRRMLGAADLADDVHQRVFVEAHRDLDRLRTHDNPRAWLLCIAHHRCLDELKWHRRWRRRFVGTSEPPEMPVAADPLARRTLDQYLSRLRPHERTAVLLRHLAGLTFEEMAEVCGEKAPALQARVSRAVARLRAWMEQDDE